MNLPESKSAKEDQVAAPERLSSQHTPSMKGQLPYNEERVPHSNPPNSPNLVCEYADDGTCSNKYLEDKDGWRSDHELEAEL